MANVVRGPIFVRTWTKKLGRGAQADLYVNRLPLLNPQGQGSAIGGSTAGDPAFQHTAFQNDTFQVSVNSSFIAFAFPVWNDGQREIRPARAVKLGRGAQIEFRQPTPLAIISNADTAASATGDAIASGDGNSLADAAGAASGDAIVSGGGAFDAYPFSNFRDEQLARYPGRAVKLGRGSQVEFGQPLPVRHLNSRDADGAAVGDAIASAGGDAAKDIAGTAAGDAIASATSDSIFFDFSVWSENVLRRGANRAVKLGRGAQIEFQTPLPIHFPTAPAADGAGSAIGDATASAGGEGVFDAVGSASGDSSATAIGAIHRRVKVISTRPTAKRGRSGVAMLGVSKGVSSSVRAATGFVIPPRGASGDGFQVGAFLDKAFQTSGFDRISGTSPRSVTEVTP